MRLHGMKNIHHARQGTAHRERRQERLPARIQPGDYGEYCESVNMDFIVSNREGYQRLRQLLT